MPSIKNIVLLFIFLFSGNILCDFSSELEDFTDDRESLEKKAPEEPTDCAKFTNVKALSYLLVSDVASIISECDVYLKTNQVNKRPVTSLPIFNVYHLEHACQDLVLKFNLFGNVTSKQFYNNDHTHLDSYLDLNSPCILNKMRDSVLRDQLPTIEPILRAVSKFKFQERKIGLMTQIFKSFKTCSLEVDIPFFYQERNFILSESEEDDLKKLFPAAESSSQMEDDLKKHVVSDKVGFGDTKVKLGFQIISDSNFCTKLGLQTTLPTALSIKSGIIGSDFMDCLHTPPINLRLLMCLVEQTLDKRNPNNAKAIQELKTIGIPTALDALDRLGAMVLDEPLGNYRHFTLGFFLEPRVKIQEGITLFGLFSYEYAFPRDEKRFFLTRKHLNIKKYEQDIKDDNEEAATQDIKQLNQAVIDTLFPGDYQTYVYPKGMLQFTIGANFRLREWDFNFGYDVWYNQKKKIGDICTINPCDRLKIAKGQNSSALQNKIFAGLSYNRITPKYDWNLALMLEESIATSGIGRDFTVAGRYEVNF